MSFLKLERWKNFFLTFQEVAQFSKEISKERKYLLTSDFPQPNPPALEKLLEGETHFQKVHFGGKMVVLFP
jgi:hypothetical protein